MNYALCLVDIPFQGSKGVMSCPDSVRFSMCVSSFVSLVVDISVGAALLFWLAPRLIQYERQ